MPERADVGFGKAFPPRLRLKSKPIDIPQKCVIRTRRTTPIIESRSRRWRTASVFCLMLKAMRIHESVIASGIRIGVARTVKEKMKQFCSFFCELMPRAAVSPGRRRQFPHEEQGEWAKLPHSGNCACSRAFPNFGRRSCRVAPTHELCRVTYASPLSLGGSDDNSHHAAVTVSFSLPESSVHLAEARCNRLS